jgi:hypothetical protein
MNTTSLLLKGLAALLASGIAAIAIAQDEEDPEDTSGIINPVEPELAITKNGQKVKHSCKADAPLIVSIIGNNNQVTVDGECKKLVVTGNSNKVTIEAVGEISALGDNLDISYKRGLGGKEPVITKVGEKIKIVKLKK